LIELRRAIGAATNKSEHLNRYAHWVSFGNGGLATAAERDEQRKMVKYTHLVANLLIAHTVVGMTRALDSLAADGHSAAITPKALAGTSPKQKVAQNKRFVSEVRVLSSTVGRRSGGELIPSPSNRDLSNPGQCSTEVNLLDQGRRVHRF